MSKFIAHHAALRLYDDVLDRSQTEMPPWHMPDAGHVVIAGRGMLRAAGYSPGLPMPAGWTLGETGYWRTARDGKTRLWVEQCGKFFTIERAVWVDGVYTRDQALAAEALAPAPIWTRTLVEAMLLAQHCDPMPRPPVAGYWADVGNVRV